MHEQSLVTALLKRVDTIRRQHDAEQVTEVRIEVGRLSGVEPLLVATAFELLAPDSSAVGARLVIDEVALLAQCRSCHHQFDVNRFVFLCPRCGGHCNVLRGDGVQLVSVSLQSSEPTREMVP